MSPRSTLLQSFILATILSIGFGAAWGLASAWSWQVVEQTVASTTGFTYLRFRLDGTPVVQAYLGNRYDTWHYRDLAGNLLDLPDNEPWLNSVYLQASPRADVEWRDIPWANRLRSFSDHLHPPHYWWFVSDGREEGHAYLVGYDSMTNVRTGFLGSAGFREALPPLQEQFPFNGQSTAALNMRVLSVQSYYYGAQYPQRYGVAAPPGTLSPWTIYVQTTDQKIYLVNLEKRTVEVMLEQPSLRSAGLHILSGSAPNTWRHQLVIRLEDQCQVRDARNQVTKQFRIPEELRAQSFSWAETSQGEALVYTTNWLDDMEAKTYYRIYWISPDGQIVRQLETVLQSGSTSKAVRVLAGVIVPVPLVVDPAIAIARPVQLLQAGRVTTWSEALRQTLGELWPSLLIAQLIAAVLAWQCYRRQVLYAVGPAERWLWPLFVFLLGLPGWVGYRYGRSWPMLERCPDCGTPVPRDRTYCPRCQADFAPPPLKGTEVFT